MLFAEVVGRAPDLIVSNRNYVKKLVFPIELLPVVSLGSASVQAAVSFSVLFFFLTIANGGLPWTVILLPLVLIPLLLLTLGIAWLLSALGVYLRDIGQVVPALLSATMFLSAIFYPLAALPPLAQRILLWGNPLVLPIEEVRQVLIYGEMPDWLGLGIYTGGASVVVVLGYSFFRATRRGFADVL